MQINAQVLQDIYKGVKTVFNKAFAEAKPTYTKVATIVPSSNRTESYKWLGKLPKLREWIGDRVIQNLAAHEYSIKNKKFEMTMGIDRDDIEDDSIGIYNPLFQEMGNSAALHPDDMVFPLLHKGFADLCYDKKTFFATNHPAGKDGKKTHSNKGVHKLVPDSYNDARVAMRTIPGEDGGIIRTVPGLLVVSPQNESIGKMILEAEKLNDNTNPYKGTAELLVLPELAEYPEEWYLLDVSRPIKPFIFQQRKKAKLIKMDSDTDENVFMKDEYLYGVDCRDNAGYSLWQLAFGSTGTTNYPV